MLWPVHLARGHDFYPRSPCGERRRGGDSCYLDNIISIHALLAESDGGKCQNLPLDTISIHALLAESDISVLLTVPSHLLFLSTLSLRRATKMDPVQVPG